MGQNLAPPARRQSGGRRRPFLGGTLRLDSLLAEWRHGRRKDETQPVRGGHKALWHPDWEGLPPEAFLTGLDHALAGLRQRLFNETYTSDTIAGHLDQGWADELRLPAGIPIVVGAFDAHMGAVGGQIEPFHLSKVMGTSTCDILVVPDDHPAAKILVKGICGQVDGSAIPGMLGLEAGQSAFGDVFAWFARLLSWPLDTILSQDETLTPDRRQRMIHTCGKPLSLSLALPLPRCHPEGMSLPWTGSTDAERRMPTKGYRGPLPDLTSAPMLHEFFVHW